MVAWKLCWKVAGCLEEMKGGLLVAWMLCWMVADYLEELRGGCWLLGSYAGWLVIVRKRFLKVAGC